MNKDEKERKRLERVIENVAGTFTAGMLDGSRDEDTY
jgi:hypothetical protein